MERCEAQPHKVGNVGNLVTTVEHTVTGQDLIRSSDASSPAGTSHQVTHFVHPEGPWNWDEDESRVLSGCFGKLGPRVF